MQIIGATSGFIRLPMLLEGLIHGIAGGLLATGGLAALVRYTDQLLLQIPLLTRYLEPVSLLHLGGLLLLSGCLLGAGGAAFSLHRYLK